MGRMSVDEVERLKRSTDLVELVRRSGVELERRGDDFVGRCPMHDDTTPSLIVTPAKNLWHCMGACQVGGSAFDWLMKTRGVSFVHAAQILREGLAPTEELPAPVNAQMTDQVLLDEVNAYYHRTLKESPEAQKYLEWRGIFSAEAVAHFQLGFANRTLGLRLPAKQTAAGQEIRKRLQDVGIVRESGHEHLNGSLTIPILDDNGHVVGMYGRKITPNLREGTPKHLYLPGPHRGVFNASMFKSSPTEIILCEALIDAITFWCAGFRNVTSTYGVDGFTDDIFSAIRNAGVKRVFIAFDRDDAGDAGTQKVCKKLIAVGIGCARINFPKGLDANEYARKVLPPEKSLALAIENAEWMAGPEPEVTSTTSPPDAEQPSAAQLPRPESSPTDVSAEALPQPSPPPARPPAALRMDMEKVGDELVFTSGPRKYRVRGLFGNTSLMTMRVNVTARSSDNFHVDTLDLHQARARAAFIKQVSVELGIAEDIVKRDVSCLYERLEDIHDANMRKTLDPQKPAEKDVSPAEQLEAMAFLKNPKLFEKIVEDFRMCGMVGESTNALVGYLAAVSRKLTRPLAVMVQSSSAAGKSSLMDAVLQFVPDEERVKYSAMTGQALYYMAEQELKNKVLAVVEEQGAEKTAYALKLLQSEGELTIASTGKDPQTGKLETKQYHVEGPVALFVTTTNATPDEELMNRCILLTVNESREQTRAIHQLQRERRTEEGLFASLLRDDIIRVHRNAQRLLRPVVVVNNLAPSLSFLDDKTRTRRDHEKYLSLIDAIALLRQYQKPHRTLEKFGKVVECIDVTADDVALANQLASQVLGRTLDELLPQDRKLLVLLREIVQKICDEQKIDQASVRISRRQIREQTGWSDFQVRVHLHRLVELEYVLMHRTPHTFLYELLYDGGGENGEKFLMGLRTTGDREGVLRPPEGFLEGFEGHLRGGRGPVEGGMRTAVSVDNRNGNEGLQRSVEKIRRETLSERINGKIASYATHHTRTAS